MRTSEANWVLLRDGADSRMPGIRDSKVAAFEQAALALTVVITDPHSVAATDGIEVTSEAPDNRFFPVECHNALIYEMATRKMLLAR